jgi:UDP-N-acetylglucosamine 2-epimerase (non-hydrolysing)
MKVVSVVGARPNFMKIAAISREMARHRDISNLIIHTGQHYDHSLSGSFFQGLGIPEPEVNLGVGSGSHSEQTARAMMGIERVLQKERPDLVLVVGDCNSTLAGALSAAKMHIPLAHVESGLRSFNMGMPEEVNRVLVDRVSHALYATEKSAVRNLLREGIPRNRIVLSGNVMIDTLLQNMDGIDSSDALRDMGLGAGNYAILTLHRPSNVDSPGDLKRILSAIGSLQERIRVVWPVHPRTARQVVAATGHEMDNLMLTGPMPYVDFLNLVKNSALVLTDSGGLQEETTALGIPCLTLREETERPVTVEQGTNTVVGTEPERILSGAFGILDGKRKGGRMPEFWDGKASERIVSDLLVRFP